MRLAQLSIRTQLVVLIMSGALLALAVGGAAISVRRVGEFERDMLATTQVLANVVGEYCVAPLAFNDQQDANAVLAGLHAHPEIISAALYDAGGDLFATYARAAEAVRNQAWPARHVPDGEARAPAAQERLAVSVPVAYGGTRYGTLQVLASTERLRTQTREFLIGMLALLLGLALFALGAAFLLQRVITRPILALADTARAITARADPAMRVAVDAGGEVGILAAGFNAMLARLDERERALRQSHQTLRALIDASPLAIVGLDPAARVTQWNAAAATLFGMAEDACLGRSVEVVPAGGELRDLARRAQAGDALGTQQLTLPGVTRQVLVSAAPLGTPEACSGAVLLVADVTAERAAQAALREREADLQRAQKLDLIGRLAGGVAHDFNNLLTVIINGCEIASHHATERERLTDLLRSIARAAERGAALTRRLLAFAKQQALSVRVLDLNGVVRDLERMLHSLAGEQIALALELAERPLYVRADAGQLEQVLLNLVLNARDALAGAGTLTVRTAAGEGGRLSLAVQDTGVGMDEATAARIFEPFFSTKPHGTGLGLPVALDIVRAFGGTIEAASQPGRGTTVTVWLPRAPAEPAVAVASEPQLAHGDETILLVEDDLAVRQMVAEVLGQAGYRVLEAQDQRAAQALIGGGARPDLLVTDVVMPGMSGPELVGQLQRLQPALRVLYISGYVGEALASYGLRAGASAMLAKPFRPAALLAAVRAELDRAAAQPEPPRVAP